MAAPRQVDIPAIVERRRGVHPSAVDMAATPLSVSCAGLCGTRNSYVVFEDKEIQVKSSGRRPATEVIVVSCRAPPHRRIAAASHFGFSDALAVVRGDGRGFGKSPFVKFNLVRKRLVNRKRASPTSKFKSET